MAHWNGQSYNTSCVNIFSHFCCKPVKLTLWLSVEKLTQLFYYESLSNYKMALFLWHNVPLMTFWVNRTTFESYFFNLKYLQWQPDIMYMTCNINDLFYICVISYGPLCLFRLFFFGMLRGYCILVFSWVTVFINLDLYNTDSTNKTFHISSNQLVMLCRSFIPMKD